MSNYQNYINNEFVDPAEFHDVLNPSTGEVIAQAPASDAAAVDQAVQAAKAAQTDWAKLPAVERAGYLTKIAAELRNHVDRFADYLVREQGKARGLATVEVNFTADYLDYMAGFARRIEGEVIPSDRPNESIFLTYQPIGVVGGILPWNFPFFLIVRKWLRPWSLATPSSSSLRMKPQSTPSSSPNWSTASACPRAYSTWSAAAAPWSAMH